MMAAGPGFPDSDPDSDPASSTNPYDTRFARAADTVGFDRPVVRARSTRDVGPLLRRRSSNDLSLIVRTSAVDPTAPPRAGATHPFTGCSVLGGAISLR